MSIKFLCELATSIRDKLQSLTGANRLSADAIKDGTNNKFVTNDCALLAGRAGGQTLNGGVAASETLTLKSTAHATPGVVSIEGDNIIIKLGDNAGAKTVQIKDSAGVTQVSINSDGLAVMANLTAESVIQATTYRPYSTSGNVVLQAKGGDRSIQHMDVNGYSKFEKIKAVQTANATPTPLFSQAIAAGEAWWFEANVVGQQGETNRAFYKIVCLFYRNTAGNVTQQGITIVLSEIKSDPAWSVDFNANTTDQTVEVVVTGALSTTINWTGVITYMKRSL